MVAVEGSLGAVVAEGAYLTVKAEGARGSNGDYPKSGAWKQNPSAASIKNAMVREMVHNALNYESNYNFRRADYKFIHFRKLCEVLKKSNFSKFGYLFRHGGCVVWI